MSVSASEAINVMISHAFNVRSETPRFMLRLAHQTNPGSGVHFMHPDSVANMAGKVTQNL
ncbi:hypothetical protein [Paraburkholderia fungorum]|nr:hypothetical protein [Paraburkholderia fungorum]